MCEPCDQRPVHQIQVGAEAEDREHRPEGIRVQHASRRVLVPRVPGRPQHHSQVHDEARVPGVSEGCTARAGDAEEVGTGGGLLGGHAGAAEERSGRCVRV